MANVKLLAQFRQGNPNYLTFRFIKAGVYMLPSDTLVIYAEITENADSRVVNKLELDIIDPDTGMVGVLLPTSLTPKPYLVTAFFDYVGEPDYRAGLGQIIIQPARTPVAIPDATVLNFSINEINQVNDVVIDSSPSAVIAAFYAQQVREDVADVTTKADEVADALASITATGQQVAAHAANITAVAGNILAYISEDANSVKLGVGGSITYVDHATDHYPSITLTLL